MTPRFDDLVVTRWGARFCGRRVPCSVGRAGIGRKTGEGDNITPLGVHRLLWLACRPDRKPRPGLDPGPLFAGGRPRIKPGAGLGRCAIGLHDKWSDDPTDAQYNQPVASIRYGPSHERLRRADGLYDLIGVLDFNHPVAVPGAGSAIFLHVWRRPRFPTAGCIAFDRRDLMWILDRWSVRSRVIVR